MIKTKLLILMLVFIYLISFSCILHAQDLCLTTAEKYFEISNYDFAITEYKRFLFFNPNYEYAGNIYYNMGQAYKNQNKWPEAIDAIRKSISKTSRDSLKDERRISMAIINIAKPDYSSAEFELLRVAHFSKFPYLKRKAYFFLGVCYLYTERWQELHEALDHYFVDSLSICSNTVDSLILLSSDLKYKSPILAKWLSTFIPGSGQIYCGYIKNGLNALILNSITSYYFVDSLIKKRYKDALISHLTIFERYYRGNRYNAERIARTYNMRINSDYAKSILDYLSTIELSRQ